MPSRPDIPLVLLVLGSLLLVLIILVNPSGQAQSTVNLGFVGAVAVIFLYAALWGVVVRKGLAVRLYRNQALGMSLVSLGFLPVFIIITISILGIVPSSILTGTLVLAFSLYGLLTFFWIDSSMRASQDMDPLSRDSLRWSKLRYVLWGLCFAGLTGDYGFFANLPPGLTSTIVQYLADLPLLVPFLAGIVALPIGAIRSKDRSFRKQLQWFALALLILFGFVILASSVGYVGAIWGEAFLATGYCFYRSTRALVPLSRISLD